MKLAIVYDRVNKWGGAERVLLALHEIWPKAPLYTAVYDKKRARWAELFEVHPSFLQHFPLAKRHHELYPWLTPMAFESFTFDNFDVVLTVTSAEAKDVITKPGTRHICYCLTPTRYLWISQKDYESAGIMGAIFRFFAPTLKKWDVVAASRPDRYIAISKRVAKRISKYYKRSVDSVIYPPVDTKKFSIGKQKDYYLCVSRLVPYKRVDTIIHAFNTLGWPLKIVGKGMMETSLRDAAKDNIEFVGELTESELCSYYQRCRALVAAGDEDFGIVALEAQACGKPVICPRSSGMAETVVEGKTGEFYDRDLVAVLRKFAKKRYDSVFCREHASAFDTERFKKEMKEAVS